MNVSGRYYSVLVLKQRLALNGAKLICWSTEISKTTGDILIYPCGSESENICTIYEPGHYGLKINSLSETLKLYSYT